MRWQAVIVCLGVAVVMGVVRGKILPSNLPKGISTEEGRIIPEDSGNHVFERRITRTLKNLHFEPLHALSEPLSAEEPCNLAPISGPVEHIPQTRPPQIPKIPSSALRAQPIPHIFPSMGPPKIPPIAIVRVNALGPIAAPQPPMAMIPLAPPPTPFMPIQIPQPPKPIGSPLSPPQPQFSIGQPSPPPAPSTPNLPPAVSTFPLLPPQMLNTPILAPSVPNMAILPPPTPNVGFRPLSPPHFPDLDLTPTGPPPGAPLPPLGSLQAPIVSLSPPLPPSAPSGPKPCSITPPRLTTTRPTSPPCSLPPPQQ